MRGAVEPLPVGGVREPEVGAQVDHEHVRAELLGYCGGLPVGQRQEHHVMPGERLGGRLRQHPVGQRRELRLQLPEPAPRAGVPGERPDLDPGMPEQQPQQLPTRISAGPGHRHTHHHADLLHLA